ncbi:hypothetical protein E4A41_01630 [Micrococcus endophyticus]|nr:hypothetical protein E4A41_01630 [Micrococcus endophyticus]
MEELAFVVGAAFFAAAGARPADPAFLSARASLAAPPLVLDADAARGAGVFASEVSLDERRAEDVAAFFFSAGAAVRAVVSSAVASASCGASSTGSAVLWIRAPRPRPRPPRRLVFNGSSCCDGSAFSLGRGGCLRGLEFPGSWR